MAHSGLLSHLQARKRRVVAAVARAAKTPMLGWLAKGSIPLQLGQNVHIQPLPSSPPVRGGMGHYLPISAHSCWASPIFSAAEATSLATVAITFFSSAYLSRSFSAIMPEKRPSGRREEGEEKVIMSEGDEGGSC